MTDELDDRIAIVGAALRVPGADDLDAFWANLLAGVEAVRTFDDTELAAAGVPERLRHDPRYVPAAGHVEGLDGFDADLFGDDVAALDPQQRLFLEVAWSALEHAGHGRGGPVGVFAGAAPSRHLVDLVRAAVAEGAPEERFAALLSRAAPDHVPLRVSHKLGLTGPSVAVQATCASSLVAVCTAAQSLADYRCDLAIAGGVSVVSPTPAGYLADGGLRSPDGHCRAFDADAAGSAPASGAGAVVLRRLSDAVEDGDPVLAVIGGWAVTNDGAARAGYAVPTPAGQAAALTEALASADVDPATVGFVEAHGSGTPLGDAVEVAALTSVLGDGRAAGSCLLGAVRANLGDLDAATGVVGLVKAALAVRTGQVPPTPHFRRPHPETALDGGPFLVNTDVAPWPVTGSPRRAGVSSIGQGGTNAHVLLEEPPSRAAPPPDRGPVLLALSAASAAALDRVAARLCDHLERHPELRMVDVAHTLTAGRRPLRHRAAVVVADRADALAALAAGSGRLLRDEEQTGSTALESTARQWLRGHDLDPAAATGGFRGTRVVLPGYPFARALSTGGPPAV